MYACFCDRCNKCISEMSPPGVVTSANDDWYKKVRVITDQGVRFDLCIDCYNIVHHKFMKSMSVVKEEDNG